MDNASRTRYQKKRIAHYDDVAVHMPFLIPLGRHAYQRRLAEVYRFLVPPGKKVIELGCGSGELLDSLRPSLGVGLDFSREMVSCAAQRFKHLRFIVADAHDLCLKESFDYIILSDLVNDLWDVQRAFQQLATISTGRTRIILNAFSHAWEWPLALCQKLRLAKPTLPQNWLTVPDIANLLELADFEMLRHWEEVLLPLPVPAVGDLFNKMLVKVWPFKWAAITNFIMARPRLSGAGQRKRATVSVIVPARNEEGNIADIVRRIPEMGAQTEIVFVEGNSRDNTYNAIEDALAANPNRRGMLLKQQGVGKGDAVALGFSKASGDVLMILDADMTVPPEDLPKFFEALSSGKGEFINGVRLVYPLEKQSMRYFNLLGNKFFSLAFSWLLGQPVKDTLCGTKVLWRSDYRDIAANRSYFGDFDPFGDFDLLFGAAKQNLKIVDLPVRYQERTYGTTNIDRWRHGWLLLKMVFFAARKIKFT